MSMFRPHRIERYVLLQLLVPFALMLLLSTVVIATAEFFGETVRSKIARGMTLDYVLQVFLFTLPHMFVIAVPIAWLMSILVTYGRLSEDFEVTAAQSAGISWGRIFSPALLGGLALALVMLVQSLMLAPLTRRQVRTVMHDLAYTQPTLMLRPNTWLEYVDDMDVWIGKIDDANQVLHDLQIYRRDDRGRTQAISAAEGYLHLVPADFEQGRESQATLELRNGTLHQSDPAKPDAYSVMEFSAVKIPFNHSRIADIARGAALRPNERSLRNLWREIGTYPDLTHPASRELWLELGYRTAWPFASLALALVAAPLGIRPYRSVRAYEAIVATFLTVAYLMMMQFARDVARVGWLHPFASTWIPNTVVAAVGLLILWRVWKR